MKVFSDGIVDSMIEDRFGKRGTQFNAAGNCTYSLPFRIEDAPAGTVSFAWILEDKDAVPVCGFSWIHWTAANATRRAYGENDSVQATDYVQGATSACGKLGPLSPVESATYQGMGAPDRPHIYELHVYALDILLNLKTGFFMNELYWAMQGHVLESVTLQGTYVN